jgi:type II secretory pathway component PulJ
MAATTVLSVILLMMVGMQDQMSKAWSNSNRRTDATREARAACRLMSEDLSCLVFRPLAFDNQDSYALGLENQGIPFLYSSNGTGPITISSSQPGAAYFFGISARKPAGTGPGDLAIVGYYIASKLTTNVSGFVTTNYNLYRHYVPASNAVEQLDSWFAAASRTPTDLFKPDPTKDDILARNTCNLRITFYNKKEGNYSSGRPNQVQNGLNYQCPSAGDNNYYSGSKIQAEISVYPEELAQKIPYTDWLNSTNIQKYARSYEFRVDVPRN